MLLRLLSVLLLIQTVLLFSLAVLSCHRTILLELFFDFLHLLSVLLLLLGTTPKP